MLRTIIRQAHTGAAAAGKVDMLPGVSGTYAYSLFQVALKEKCLPEVVSKSLQVLLLLYITHLYLQNKGKH